jgi:hypothetical protein
MNKQQAFEVLDRVRYGFKETDEKIAHALTVTGDLQSTSGALRETRRESCYTRSRQIYGASAYERVFGIIQEVGCRRQTED